MDIAPKKVKVISRKISLKTHGDTDIHNITGEIIAQLEDSGLTDGTVTVFVPGATAGITTVEYEPGLVKDLQALFEKLVPKEGKYAHDKRWKDMNGYAHVRASLLGPSLTVPFLKGELTLGTWQQIVLIDFDNRPRLRHLILQIIGE